MLLAVTSLLFRSDRSYPFGKSFQLITVTVLLSYCPTVLKLEPLSYLLPLDKPLLAGVGL